MQARDFTRQDHAPSTASSGLWRIAGDRLIPVDRGYAGPTTVLAPSEDILIVVADLPFATRRQRIDAAPFAVEPLVGEPIERSHVALGVEISPRTHLCGVVRHETMGRWVALMAAQGLERAILIPDALMLATPPPGAWRLAVAESRVLVRTEDGGFATSVEGLPTLWQAAGEPQLLATGEALPEAMQAGLAETSFDLHYAGHPVLVTPPLDLRQGVYAALRTTTGMSPLRELATVLAVGLAAHLSILAVDTVALSLSADRAEANTRALLAERSPGAAGEPDLAIAVDRATPVAVGGQGPFITTLSRASQALLGTGTTFRAVSYTPGAPLQLAVTTPDAVRLETAVGALNRSGLDATSRLDPVVGDASGGLNAAIAVQATGGRP